MGIGSGAMVVDRMKVRIDTPLEAIRLVWGCTHTKPQTRPATQVVFVKPRYTVS